MSRTIKEVKELLSQSNLSSEVLTELAADERKGVKNALTSYYRRVEKEEKEQLRYEKMFTYEQEAYQKGAKYIAGIDEVGRGPLAGPVVTAAVILPEDVELLGINDSKQLSQAKRESLFDEIQEKALAIGIGVISAEEIDAVNIYQATINGMVQAVNHLEICPDYLLIDAMKLPQLTIQQESLIKGDAKSISIAAASVIAKVTRDRMMVEADKQYPGYGFAQNAGYGTAEHLAGLEKQGVTSIHRKTFAPVKDMI